MTKKKYKQPTQHFWEASWFKMLGYCITASSVVASIIVFYYQNHENDLKERFQDKLEFQKQDCDRDNKERILQLKLEIQSEYFIQPSPNSPTAVKMEKVFKRIDKSNLK